MKNILSFFLFAILLAGCSDNTENNEQTNAAGRASVESESSVSEETPAEEKEPIVDLNQNGEITSNGEVVYTVTATEVVDVTEEAANELINDTNYLDYASNGQGQQAIKITLLMENMSGDVLGMPYLDDVKVIDSAGVTNLGGWKDESGLKTDFGSYSLDENLNVKEDQYTVQNGESRMATSTVILANDSETINFKFYSQKYDDYINFELPVK